MSRRLAGLVVAMALLVGAMVPVQPTGVPEREHALALWP